MLENDTSGPKTKYELQVTPTTSSVTISITGSANDNVDYIKIQQLGGPTSTVTLNVTGIGSIDQFTRSGSGSGKVAIDLLQPNGNIGFDGIVSGRYIEATSINTIDVLGSNREVWTPIRTLSGGGSIETVSIRNGNLYADVRSEDGAIGVVEALNGSILGSISNPVVEIECFNTSTQ